AMQETISGRGEETVHLRVQSDSANPVIALHHQGLDDGQLRVQVPKLDIPPAIPGEHVAPVGTEDLVLEAIAVRHWSREHPVLSSLGLPKKQLIPDIIHARARGHALVIGVDFTPANQIADVNLRFHSPLSGMPDPHEEIDPAEGQALTIRAESHRIN